MVKKALFVTILGTVLSAGILSARQLSTSPKLFPFCHGGTCSRTVHCPGTCFCNLDGPAAGFCTQDPIGAKPVTKPAASR